MVNRNRVITRESIAEHIWGDNSTFADNLILSTVILKTSGRKLSRKREYYLHNIYGIDINSVNDEIASKNEPGLFILSASAFAVAGLVTILFSHVP